MRVLVVDDSAVSRKVLVRQIEALGHTVVAAENAEAALVALEDAYSVVISDWNMPGMSGVDLVRRIRADETRRVAEGLGRRYAYLILLTARDDKQSYLEGMAAGADDFLSKAFEHEQLLTRLKVAERISQLQAEVNQLSGLLPICSFCKKIREAGDEGSLLPPTWVPVEAYVSQRIDASFTHSICPDCYATRIKPQLGNQPRGQ
ncbi:MAG: PleD family two-component system response regulator [Vicinamibacteria bacterium]